MRLKMFEDFGRPYRKLTPNFSEKEITDIGNTIISLLDSFCDDYRLRTNVSISHDEISIVDDEAVFKSNGPTFQWNISCPMNLSIDIYTAGRPGGSAILSELYEYIRNRFIDRIKSKYHVYTFNKYEGVSDIDIWVVNDDGDYLPNVWLGEVAIVLGQ